MLRNPRTIVMLIFLCLSVVFAGAILRNCRKTAGKPDAYSGVLAVAPPEADPLSGLNEDFTVKPDFSSHLPIIVIDTNGVEPPVSARMNVEEDRFVPIEGVEPYVDGRMELIAGNRARSRLSALPSVVSDIRIKRRGNSSMLYEKPQYLMKLVTESGYNNKLSLLEMGEEHEWILNGSMADKSMMRNYLAYRLTSRVMPYTPDSRYCEVLLKDGNTYTYQGVYLLCESIRQGADRVAVSPYNPDAPYNSFLVRRDRYDEHGVMLNTYATAVGLSHGWLGLLYPGKYDADTKMISFVTQQLSTIERILYADDFSTYASYPDYIDVDSFVDYFLINEFFASYDAGEYSTYMYQEIGGKLCMGPVWDFDGTMDNYRQEPLQADVLAFQEKPWFQQLVKDHTFISKLEKRYAYLRRSALSNHTVSREIDAVKAHIGSAQVREWARWSHIYTQSGEYSLEPYMDEDGTLLYRETTEYEQEIYHLKTILRKHADAIPARLALLHKSAVWQTGMSGRIGWLLFLCLGFFFIPAIFAGRK